MRAASLLITQKMNSLKVNVILLSLLTLAIITQAQEDANYLYHNCQNATTSTLNSTYRVDQSPVYYIWKLQNITTEPQRFNNVVGAAVNDLAARAASAPPGAKKFAVNKTSFDAFRNIYSLAQCTPDLSSFDCNQCLSAAIASRSRLTASSTSARGSSFSPTSSFSDKTRR
ncbi:hypothetical protein H0E87_009304 [Populus deltoides]|uniref:Gnk2-homologous domain-containing protein n=1 Tax=Populus deltoides TaxID=3696 RepID=A0A8T2Z3U9_POPDE|nr:hypothetical protein H0E87_009304 [Populus deltoides]